jgi:glycosyltransferase involved in cell wall biosynthesis
MSKLPLSVAIIAYNEEARLPRCLQSVQAIAGEIVVVDDGSKDRTVEIAEQHGARVIKHEWLGYVGQKNFAWEQCREPWVLSIDADEVLTPELAASIERTLQGEELLDGYALNRRTFYLGDWIWHAWYPEWRPRLARREKARWKGVDPHDYLDVQGRVGKLEGDLLHYSYKDLQDHLKRTLDYARIGAEGDIQAGKRFRWHKLVFSPWVRFWRCILVKQAWRDGWRGWIIASSALIAATAKYAFIYEHERNQRLGKKPGA